MKQANLIPKDYQPKPGFMQRMRTSTRARIAVAFIAVAPLIGSISCATPGRKVPFVELTQSGREIVISNVGQIKNEYLDAADKTTDTDAKTAVKRLIEIFVSYDDGGVRDVVISGLAEIRAAAIPAGDTATAQAASAFLAQQGFAPQ